LSSTTSERAVEDDVVVVVGELLGAGGGLDTLWLEGIEAQTSFEKADVVCELVALTR
jgi:hypothetical protein